MAKPYQHLTLSNRIPIEHERCKGSSCQDIAQMLKVHRTTIARELRRNSLLNGRMTINKRISERNVGVLLPVRNDDPKLLNCGTNSPKRYDNIRGKCRRNFIMGARLKSRDAPA